ncbi:hypothetical protein ACFQ49_05145 [Kroppenstedtia eburnea]|uniref:Uncharacterized protein n=1 Tax=Kroppenstedtia eburnea TaxID=714067 RepID=A0A1N7IXV1_9BACL|nr:primosome assembly protein PriA [Kroppenstedtia eburnea]EGK13368.1 primosome assembly protein PriA [Desmospora sp. 8437]QKI82311.1 hypothetical protein GXN75_10010 [Kroppenstedtia eburnea]SGO91426.1 Uncharacterised protein [Mycobacterium tuberculosis]SIS41938.1 hypothetical protein SAMN05421790_101487 [Kroppenstedtia eburnea]
MADSLEEQLARKYGLPLKQTRQIVQHARDRLEAEQLCQHENEPTYRCPQCAMKWYQVTFSFTCPRCGSRVEKGEP